MNTDMSLVVAIYSHPEYYPPTLNAIECLAPYYKDISIVHRNVKGFGWNYPSNVKLYSFGKLRDVSSVEKAGLFNKILWFFKFSWLFFIKASQYNTHTVLIYDVLPVFSYRLFKGLIRRPKVLWYHNHDVGDPAYLKKYSLSWLGWKSEYWLFRNLNIFTLPAVERKVFFPLKKFKGLFFLIPNYPMYATIGKLKTLAKKSETFINILYQGSIGPDHGLEEIISLLDRKIVGRPLFLILKGFISDAYKQQLVQIAHQSQVMDRLIFLPPSDYAEVIRNTMQCHIGIAIYKKQDIMNNSLGTASNKIYEYAACGLPVILYANKHFREVLQNRKWAFFSNSERESIFDVLNTITMNYEYYSNQALLDFEEDLNFETHFAFILGNIQSHLGQN